MRAMLLLAVLLATPAAARDALGVFDGWGAFRDRQPLRCFAIAEPEARGTASWRPFASLSHWPDKGVRGQLHVRLSHARDESKPVRLTIDDRAWTLTGSQYDVWAPSAQHDAFIIAKLRAGKLMTIAATARDGQRFADRYELKGIASAVDAAALGCAARR